MKLSYNFTTQFQGKQNITTWAAWFITMYKVVHGCFW